MKKLKLSLALGCCLLASGISGAAQQEASTSATSGTGNFGSQGIRDYLLGPGDILELRVFNETQFDGPLEVASDGTIAVPFIEMPIIAKCRRAEEVKKDITAALGKMLRRPSVTLLVKERRSRTPATVFGAVLTPQRYEMNRRATLIELISMSGGFTEKAAGTIQVIHTQDAICEQDTAPTRASNIPLSALATNATPTDNSPTVASSAAITGVQRTQDATGGDTATDANANANSTSAVLSTERDATRLPMEIYNIEDVKAGKENANPVIRPGDVIKVEEAQPVYVVGSVNAPQGIYLRPNMTLSRALAMVGGTTRIAKKDKIRIRRQLPNASQAEVITVNYEAIRNQKANDIYLQPYDIIEVGEAGVFSRQRFPELFTTIASQSIGGFAGNLPLRVLY